MKLHFTHDKVYTVLFQNKHERFGRYSSRKILAIRNNDMIYFEILSPNKKVKRMTNLW